MIAGKEEQPNRKMISAQPGEERNMVGGGAVDGGIPGEQDDNEVVTISRYKWCGKLTKRKSLKQCVRDEGEINSR